MSCDEKLNASDIKLTADDDDDDDDVVVAGLLVLFVCVEVVSLIDNGDGDGCEQARCARKKNGWLIYSGQSIRAVVSTYSSHAISLADNRINNIVL
jgi:hypothetical protein